MKRTWLVTLVSVMAMALGTGAAHAGVETTACTGPADEMIICVNGQRLAFDAPIKPHMHETGSIYAPVDVLQKKLNLDAQGQISADGKSAAVTLNGKPFRPAMASGAKGVHIHNGHVFVPVREFVAAAGLKVEIDGLHAGIAN